MSFLPDKGDLDLLFQQTKQIYSKIEILNQNYLVVKSIEGVLINDNFNNDATSNIRRTYSCTLQVTTPLLKFDKNEDFWFNRYIRPYIGIYSIKRKEIVWYLKGTFCAANASHVYSQSDNTLTVSCNDMMCRLTGDLDGKQTALSFLIPSGENIRKSIIGILETFGFTKYNIPELPRDVQFDLEFGAGATAYDMISELMQFAPNYEFFFDLEGTFVVQRIPCYTNDPNIMDQETFEKLLVSEDSYTVNFTAKNCVEVWGKQYDEDTVDRFIDIDSCAYTDNVYTATVDNLRTPYYEVDFTTTIDNQFHPGLKKDLFRAQIKDAAGDFTCTYDLDDATWHIVGGNLVEEIDEIVSEYDAKHIWGLEYDDGIPDSSEFDITITMTKRIRNYLIFGIEIPANNLDGFRIKFFNKQTEGGEVIEEYLGPFDVIDDYDREIAADTLEEGTSYLFMFERDDNASETTELIRYLGHLTPHAIYKNEDNSSSFSIDNMGKEYWEICADGEYANITSDLLARERAMYECYYKANLNESLQLTLLDVPWLDVNKKIIYRRTLSDDSIPWLIQSVSDETLQGTCSIQMVRFYPDWSEIFNNMGG